MRVEFPGAIYHVTARGNERREIYRDDEDRRHFLDVLDSASQEYGLRVHAFCLMPNHYHLLLETPRPNLSRAMAWIQSTYSIGFNRRHRRSGHLFQGRFKAQVADAEDYARQLVCYVHLNPVRPRNKDAIVPVERRGSLDQWKWSSHLAYLGQAPVPAWLCTDWLVFFGRTRVQARRNYQSLMDEAFGKRVESPWEHLKWGLALGNAALQQRVRSLLRKKNRPEELKWVARTERGNERRQAAVLLAARQPERPIQVWIRVHLGGERRIDIARACGYGDGSAITQMLKRLRTRAESDLVLSKRLSQIKAEFNRSPSCVRR